MTIQEAIERLKYFQKNDGIKKMFRRLNKDAVKEAEELIIMCIEALEKQIPKKMHEDFTGLFWTCTECGNIAFSFDTPVMMPMPKYCPNCGQRLLWEGE